MSIHGNKTYATAATVIASTWIAFIFDVDLGEGAMSLQSALEITAAALVAAFVRHGIATETKGSTAAGIIALMLVLPACTAARYAPGEQGAKLQYADAREALTAAQRTTIRLRETGVLDAMDVVRIDAVIQPASEALERSWARIVAGDYGPDTRSLIDTVLDAVEQVLLIHATKESTDGRNATSRTGRDGPEPHVAGHHFGRAEEPGGHAVRPAA